MLAFVDLEERVPQDHPIRTIKIIVGASVAGVRPNVLEGGSSVGAAGTSAEGIAAHLSLLGASERAFWRSSNTTCCSAGSLT